MQDSQNERWYNKFVGYIHRLKNAEYKSPFYEFRRGVRGEPGVRHGVIRILSKIGVEATPSILEQGQIIAKIVCETEHNKNIPLGRMLKRMLGDDSARLDTLVALRLEAAGMQLVRLGHRARGAGRKFNHFDLAEKVALWNRQHPETGIFYARERLCEEFYRKLPVKKVVVNG